MFTPFYKKKSGILTGITATNNGIAIASINRHGKAGAKLQSCKFETIATEDSDAMAKLFKREGLDKEPCSTLLEIGEYQLLIVDAPDVPPEELRAAVRWQVQDLIDFHTDDAVIDVFDSPPGGPAETRKQMYVVIVPAETVKQRIDLLENAGAKLGSIDIPELAMRNIAALLPEDETGLVTLKFNPHQCLITLTYQSTLYLTRSIDFGYLDLQEVASNPYQLVHRLALEIQRSIDFYEQHYHKAPIKAVAMLALPITIDSLDEMLQQTLGMTVRTITLTDILDFEHNLDQDSSASCLMAAGCALRSDASAL